MLLGRKNIALKSGKDEVELNVSTSIRYSYTKEISKKASAKDSKNTSDKTDQAGEIERSIVIQTVLSSTTDLLTLSKVSAKEKLNQLVAWQNSGATIALLGYGTGGYLSKILENLPSIFQYRPAPLDEKFLGTAYDEIGNLQVKDIDFEQTVEMGSDFSVNIVLVPQVKVPETPAIAGAKKIATKGKAQPKETTKTDPPTKPKSMLKSLF